MDLDPGVTNEERKTRNKAGGQATSSGKFAKVNCFAISHLLMALLKCLLIAPNI